MKILKGYKSHWVSDNGKVILSKNNTIFEYDYENDQFSNIIRLNYSNKIFNTLNRGLIERLLRGGVSHVIKNNNRLVIFFNNRIFTVDRQDIINTYKISTCKRPLNICVRTNSNTIYWGDYVASSDRVPIHIYCSNDKGLSWNVVYTFPEKSIRHIHNIVYDEFRDAYLILTGDKNNESGIWITKDFTKVEPFLIGKQKYRATSLIVKDDYLIIPTDTELEKNCIQKYKLVKKTIESIIEIPSSSIGAKAIKGYSFVSSMVEPSDVNKTENVNLYISKDDLKWSKLYSATKDIFSGKYFQYASIQIPNYDSNYTGNNYYFNLLNTKENNGVLILTENEIQESLNK